MLSNYTKPWIQTCVLLASACYCLPSFAGRLEDGTVRSVDLGNQTVLLEEAQYNAVTPIVIHDLNDESTALSDLSKLAIGMPIRVSLEEADGREHISEIWILRTDHSEVD